MGRGFKSIFYWSLKNLMGMNRIEIASKPEELGKYLDVMFPSDATQVKDETSNQICIDLGIERNGDDQVRLMKRGVGVKKVEFFDS